MHTTVIIAADRREARSELGTALCVRQPGMFILLIRYVSQQFQWLTRGTIGFLITDARCRALVRVARRLVVEMIASETFGVILCVQVHIECFCQGEMLDFIIFYPRVCRLPP